MLRDVRALGIPPADGALSPGPFTAQLLPDPAWLSGHAEGVKQVSLAWAEDRKCLGKILDTLIQANRDLCEVLGALTVEAGGTLCYRGLDGPVAIPPAIQERLKKSLHLTIIETPGAPGTNRKGPSEGQGGT